MAEHQKVNILMVDDQPGKLVTYEAILNELDENLIQARSGKEALEHLLKTNVAVVLMDVSMPELDGFELADMIRQHPRFQNTGSFSFLRCISQISSVLKPSSAAPWITLRFRLFPNCCAQKCVSSPISI